jgi:AcrR family transcriptional regulator
MAIVNSYTENMPTPDRTSLDAIVLAARDLLESDGLAGLTMHAVAHRVGVRPPSLYKRVESRDRLIQLVAEATLTDLNARLSTDQSVAEIATVFRAFGLERPAAFQLVLTPAAGTPTADASFLVASSAAILSAAGRLAGEENALEAARTVVAWATGFITMELNGSFQLGGDVDRAWQFGVARIVDALKADPA